MRQGNARWVNNPDKPDMLDLSVCIVNWNAADMLAACLASIYQYDWRVALEVIVLDNASTDGSAAMVARDFPQVRQIISETNVGFAAAVNQMFRVARGRHLLLLNNDTLVLAGALDALVDFMERHDGAGIVGPRVRNPDGSLQRSCRGFPTLWTLLWRATYLDKLLPSSRWAGADTLSGWPHDEVRAVDVVSGSCLLARRKMIEQVGPLDEGFFMYFEETDWCYRARRAGWQVLFTPDAEIVHYGGQSSARQAPELSVVYYRSLVRYFRKHHGPVSALAARLLAAMETGSRLSYWSLARLTAHGDRLEAARRIGQCRPALRWLLTGRAPQIADLPMS